MDLKDKSIRAYIERAENSFRLAKAVHNLSGNEEVKISLEANPNDTFYSAVITHAYYSMFYIAKAYLMSKGIMTSPPDEHKKIYEQLVKCTEKGILRYDLLKIYEEIAIKAETLLGIFDNEKWKRSHTTRKPDCFIDGKL